METYRRSFALCEVSAKDTAPATYYALSIIKIVTFDGFLTWNNRPLASVAEFVYECLGIYQRSNEGLAESCPFVVHIDGLSRYDAGVLMASLHHCFYTGERNGTSLYYTVDWWHRTPSSAGIGPLLIGFRIYGIMEL